MRSRKGVAALAGLLVAAACDPNPAGPGRSLPEATVSFNHTTVPNLSSGELLFVCKDASSPAGTYTFNIQTNGGVAQPGVDASGNFTLAAGACLHVATKGGTQTTMSVTETSLPPGIQLDRIVRDQASGTVAGGNHQVVTTTITGTPTATALVGGNPAHAATLTFFNIAAPAGAVLLIIDEDGIDNGLHFHPTGGLITPAGPKFFSASGVNDDVPGKKQRDVLRYFANNIGRTITVRTGQTGDEGWFAPNCIPAKWIWANNKDDDTCLTNGLRQTVIDNYFGKNGPSEVPEQERLDKVPHVIPLRALGLNSLIGKTVCAVVYDSDVSINYDHGKPIGVNGNLQNETLGIVAFDVLLVRTLTGFSSSTLPQVTITIRSTSVCGNWVLFNAPVPTSSSVPNDRYAPGSPNGYLSLTVWPGNPLFY